MAHLYVLFEHAVGYALFLVKEFEETGMFLAQVEQSVTDLKKFNAVVKLVGFVPFKTALKALEGINSVSEGILSEELQLFLETNIPQNVKKTKVILGIVEPKLAAAVNETLGFNCQHTGVVPEIVRGIRLHFSSLVKGLNAQSSGKAQLGLGHSYSRAKVKFNIHRSDNMIIQSIALLDQLDKDVNTFCMRIREWYSYHFPELIKIVPEYQLFSKAAAFICNRKELDESKLDGLEEIVQDRGKAQAILEASKSSMGMDISPMDLLNIKHFAARVIDLIEYRKSLHEYLRSKMDAVAPNLASLIGEQVGARLISHAGSLTNLAKFPASTVQILGAEKALFRALKTRSNTPKYGLIFHSTFIGRAGLKNKGRISRYLANKCSIASRIDCFTDNPNRVFGNKMRDQVEERLKYFETGEMPKRNVEVMQEAIAEFNAELEREKEKEKQKKKKKKKNKEKRKSEADQSEADVTNNGDGVEEVDIEPAGSAKKSKKKRKSEIVKSEADVTNNGDGLEEVDVEPAESVKKSKKKRKRSELEDSVAEVSFVNGSNENGVKQKKKKKKLNLTN